MKEEPIYKMDQEEIKKLLKLSNQEFQDLKRVFNIQTKEPLSFNQTRGFISYLQRTSKVAIKIEDLNLKDFKPVENLQITKDILDTPEPKKIKIYKEKRQKVILKNKSDIDLFKTHEEAAIAYRLENKNIYWAINSFEIDKKQKFDNSGSFSFNFKKIKKLHPKGKIFLFTDNTYYEKITMNSRKKISFTPEQDKKILEYYNSDFYKYRKVENGKNPYTMKDLQKDLKVKDRKIIVQRASELGFTNFVVPKIGNEYCEEELKILKENVGKITTKKIQQLLKEKGYKKSIVSINVKLTRLNLSLKLDGTNDLTLTLLAKALGVDLHVITDNKNLMSKVKPEKTNKELIFTREKVRDFIIQNPYDLNFGKVDNKFLVDLLVGDKNANP